MRFTEFATKANSFPIFDSSLTYPFYPSPQHAQRQLSDWVRSGHLIQLRRGLYTFASSHLQEQPLRYTIANHLIKPSYVSLQTALSYYGMIPEHVAVITSITTGRPKKLSTPLGRFIFRHVKRAFFHGFEYRQITHQQYAFLATPEKALLDLIYLTPNGDDPAYIQELRLQNLDVVNINRLQEFVDQSNKPKLKRVLPHLLAAIYEDTEGYDTL